MKVVSRSKQIIWILSFACAILIYVSYILCENVLAKKNECEHVFEQSPDGFKIILSSVKLGKKWMCEYPLTIAMPKNYSQTIKLDDYPNLKIIFYENNTFNDYYKFDDNEIIRATPKFETKQIVKDVHVPANKHLFDEYWKRSKLIHCENIIMMRIPKRRVLPVETSLRALSRLRDVLTQYNMFPFLEGGTLLGWYRECDVIPHTSDMDFVVPIEELNPLAEEYFRNKSSSFRLSRKLGDPRDSLEFTVEPSAGFKTSIDIFFMYHDDKEYWIAGTDGRGNKYRYSFPFYDPFCAATIHGYVFWVTCSPQEILTVSFGDKWYKDHLTSKFVWSSSSKNVRKVGKFTKDEMKEFYEIL